MNEKHRAFVEIFVENGGNATAAYKAAGYNGDSGNASRMARKLSNQINDAYRAKMTSFSGKVLSRLEQIIMSQDTAPRDVIAAASNWLDRSGLQRGSTVDLTQRVEPKEERPLLKRWTGKNIMFEISEGFWLPAKDGDLEEGQDRTWDQSCPITRKHMATLC